MAIRRINGVFVLKQIRFAPEEVSRAKLTCKDCKHVGGGMVAVGVTVMYPCKKFNVHVAPSVGLTCPGMDKKDSLQSCMACENYILRLDGANGWIRPHCAITQHRVSALDVCRDFKMAKDYKS